MQDLAGRTIRVDYATQRAPGERPGGSLPRGGGGYSPTGVHRDNSNFGGNGDFGGGSRFGGNSDWRWMWRHHVVAACVWSCIWVIFCTQMFCGLQSKFWAWTHQVWLQSMNHLRVRALVYTQSGYELYPKPWGTHAAKAEAFFIG